MPQSILVKRILLLIIVISAVSCSKENLNHSIVGDWTIVDRMVGTGSTGPMQTSPILSQCILHFNSNGTFVVADSDSANFLQPYTLYEVIGGQSIRFYNSDKTQSAEVNFSLDQNLRLFYPARCGYQEIFTRQ
jgi:hypothetical protein